MKKIFSFTKKKKQSSGTPDNVSALSEGYDLKDKDLGKIHKAALQGDLAKLKQLVKKNDINHPDKENRTALHIACASGHAEAVQFLVDSKAKLDMRDNQNRSALMKAVQGQHERCASILLEKHADPNLEDLNGNTALHLAANIPSISTAVLLLQHGAEINAQNVEGFTPLTVAVREDRVEMAEYLLKETADVNCLDQERRSPLMLAASSGQHSMVKLLLQYDPDVTLQDSRGWSADDYAVKNGHHSCCLLITEHGTKRTHTASVTYPGPSKKKKTQGNSSQDVKAGFSLGGPATDKEHGTNEAGGVLEDNSLSESVSRASRSANDEWPSSEDEDESLEKKPLKVNLSRIFGTKMGEAPVLPDTSLSDAESEPEYETSVQRNPVDPHPVPSLSKSPQITSTPLQIPIKEDSSAGEDSEEEEDDDEEEEEEDEEDESEENEEEGSEEEENDSSVSDSEDVQNHSGNYINADIQNILYTNASPDAGTSVRKTVEILDASEKNGKAQTVISDINSPTGAKTRASPATLDVAGDCIVSAIRVESKLSDEEDSITKESVRSFNLYQSSNMIRSPGKVREMESEREERNHEKDSEEQISADNVWDDIDYEEQKETEGAITFSGKLLANLGKNPETNVDDDALSSRAPYEEGRRRSSWGSSVDGSDDDVPKEAREKDIQPLDAQPEETILPSTKEQRDTWDSSSLEPADRVIDNSEAFGKACLSSSVQVKNKPGVGTGDDSDWDSSESHNQNEPGGKCDMASLDLQAASGETEETHNCSLEDEERDGIEKESNDPSPVVSVVIDDEGTTGVMLREDGKTSATFSQKEEKSDLENEEENSSSWDDEEDTGESKNENVSKTKSNNIQSENDIEEIPCSLIEGNYEAKDEIKAQGDALVVDENCESSEDSDSKHHRLKYDFAGAAVQLVDAGDDSSSHVHQSGSFGERARLTSYTPLENKTSSVKARESDEEGRRRETVFSRPPTKGVDTSSHNRSSEVSDDALPQTDIDDVELSSPDQSENTSKRWHELKSNEEPAIQEQNSTEGKRENYGEEERDVDEDNEGNTSADDNQSEDGGEVHGAASTVHQANVVEEKKRDFRLELGLEMGEEDESSWDSESNSELSNVPHKEEQDLHHQHPEETSRGEELPKETGGTSDVDRGGLPDESVAVREKNESPTRELLSVFSKPKEDVDIMEELGVGDVDDLEDGSDWDSASTVSKRTLPGRRMPSSGLEDFQEDADSSRAERKEGRVLPAPSTPQRSSGSVEHLPSTPSKSAPQPQPRARKRIRHKSDEEEESDFEPEKTESSEEMSPSDERLENLLNPQARVEPGAADVSPMSRLAQGSVDFEEHQEKEKDDAVDGCEFGLHGLDHAGSDMETKVSGNTPWEKRYEKLWVEVEKREVKSSFKNVAVELKERFGELFKLRRPAENPEEDTCPASSSAGEESSDEEEGEVVVRPAARGRSMVLLTIPEQRESGQEESVAESADSLSREEKLLENDRTVGDGFIHHMSALLTADVGGRAASSQDEGKHHTDHHTGVTSKDKTTTTDAAARVQEARRTDAGLEDRRMSELASQKRRPDFSNGGGNEEKETTKFNLEVSGEATVAAMEEQKSRSSWQSRETAVEKVDSGKPESGLGCLSNQAEGSHQPVPVQSTHRAPVQQSCTSRKQDSPAVDGAIQLELSVRGARPRGAPQPSTHVNGDPSSVFDDSSLSDMLDDEERLKTAGQLKSKSHKEIEMAEDLDELTQSSDTATDDMDSPTSGYRHASLLIQKLDSSTLDSTSITKLQNIFHEYERSIQKVRSRHGYLAEKVSHLEMERTTLKESLEEVKDAKSLLERNQLELQTDVTNLKFQLKQEQENRHNATMMYNTTRDKLRRMEEQHQLGVQERHNLELTLRNLELEMRTLISNMKQLEDEHSDTQRLLAQERSARALQENLLGSQLRKQQEMEAESRRTISRSNEALSQLTEASDRERELLQQTSSLQEQLSLLRSDLEQSQANSILKESHLVEENETIKEQLDDVRRDLRLSNEAVTQTVFTCNNQLAALKSELAKTTSRLENDRQAREALEAEVESTRSRLAGAVKEAELHLAAHSDAEKALLREREEHQRLKDRLTGELAAQREAVSSLSQKLSKAEACANSMENEVHRVTLQLTEKGLLLDVLQREKEQATTRAKELENTVQEEREQVSRASACQAAMQERHAQAHSEAMLLRQQLEEAQNKGVAKERAVTDAQERFSDILSKLRLDCEGRVQLVEERNKELASKAADLRDQIYKLQEEKNEREANVRQLQQELADSLKKLSMSEASLEVNTRYRNDLEEEKARLKKDNDRLRGKLEESEDQYVQAERRVSSLKSSLGEREQELSNAAQKLQEALSGSATSEITIKHLEEAVQKLEIENARLEAAAKQQSNKIEALQKGAQEAAMVRGRLEDLVTNLQSSKMTLEEQLNKEVQKQSTLSHTAQDSQALWEEELKSRSKLGLRLAELEKEKGDLTALMEIEKKKAKKTAEQKKAVDTRLDQEMNRNMELQKEMYRLRALLKTTKKKLRDQEAGGAELSSPMSPFRMDLGRNQADGSFGWMKNKVEDLQGQLEKETSRRHQLDKINEELKVQVASLNGSGCSNGEVDRSKRQLEEEVLELRRRIQATEADQGQVDKYRCEAEGKARQEIQQKLEQINLFLQAASQEALDQIKAANEANLRSQFEQRIRELEGKLDRARTGQLDSLNQKESTRSELERYRQLYAEEMHLRKSLAAKLERANSRLSEANSKLLSERSRSFITGNITNGSLVGPSLDLSSLGSPANPGATLGSLNRSFGLGFPLSSPVTDGQNRRVEDYLAKMQSELDKNISKELSNAAAELDAASARLSPVGSACRAELDPLSRATQQYLEVLKKNHRI